MARISKYSFGAITVDGENFNQDLIILRDRIISNWWRRTGHKLLPEDLDAVIAAAPKRLIIGTGAFGLMRVPAGIVKSLRDKSIESVILRTQEACDFYNEHSGEDCAAALHLTC